VSTFLVGGPALRLAPESMAAGGHAVARDADGRVVFVEGALPGEIVEAVVYDAHPTFARAALVGVIQSSPQRVEPPCPHVARGCGGCGWQHISPPAQVDLKVGLVGEALRRAGGTEGAAAAARVLGGPTLASFDYRTTMRVSVTGPDEELGEPHEGAAGARGGRPGFRRARRHDIVEVDSCLVAHPLLEELLATGDFGLARGALLRAGARTGQRLCVLSPTVSGADLGPDVRVIGQDQLAAGRRAWIFEEIAGVRLRVSAGSFFQARPDGAEVLVELVGQALDGAGPGPLVDAYGGVGLFGATVGQGRPVTLIETSASALADARVNLPAARALSVDVERWRPQPATAVVADPPRAGLGKRAVAVLAGTGASHLALVSCDPASLGRDAALLGAHGFQMQWARVVDMFPGTPHIETVASFVR
jgi:23S rRNA (uracil1939-C5)-methyltransferase